MIDPLSPKPMTLHEYDRLTPPPGEMYELYDGYIVAFSTGTGAHGLLCTRISTLLDTHTEPPCRAFGPSTIGVRRMGRATNVIPDGAVTCEERDDSRTYILAPKLVVEVISPGQSIKRDRVDKLDIYCAMPSVEEYLMVDSRKVWACIYRRVPGDAWIAVTRTSLDDKIDLLSINARLDLGHIYRGINLTGRRSA